MLGSKAVLNGSNFYCTLKNSYFVVKCNIALPRRFCVATTSRTVPSCTFYQLSSVSVKLEFSQNVRCIPAYQGSSYELDVLSLGKFCIVVAAKIFHAVTVQVDIVECLIVITSFSESGERLARERLFLETGGI